MRVPLIAAGLVLACASPAFGASRLSGEWKLDEGAGSIVTDTAGANHGVIVTDDGQRPAWIQGVQGFGLRFSGKGSVRLPDAAIFESPQLSVEAWVRRTGSPGAFRYVISKGGSACETSSYGLYTGPGGGMSFYVLGPGGYVRTPEQTPAKVWDGNWHQIVGAYDGDGVHLYVDGTEVGTGKAGPSSIAYGLPSKSPFLGAYGGSCALPYDGDLDVVRLYTTALSAQSLTQSVQTPGARPVLPTGSTTTTASASCLRVTTTKVRLKRGRKATVTVTIRRGSAAVAKRRVQLSGGGLKSRIRKTDARGRVRFSIRPKRTTTVKVVPLGQGKGCKRLALRVAR